ncbi:MAG: type IV pilus assembly protein PilM [Patescibacteria group bacterium]
MFSNKEKNCFGLDFSDYILRIVQFFKLRGDIKLRAYGEIKIPPGLIQNGIIKNEDKVAKSIKDLLKNLQGKVTGHNVVACLPEKTSFIKVIDLPEAETNIEGIVKKDLPNHIPLSLNEVYYDWQNLGKSGNNSRILIGASPKIIVDGYVRTLEKANLVPYALEIESVAITRCLSKIKEKSNGAQIIIDLGFDRSTIILAENDEVMFTTSSTEIGGNQMTKAVAQKLKLSIREAEKAKTIFGLNERGSKGEVRNIMLPIVNNLKKRIIDTINYYQDNFTNHKPIEVIIFSGGGARLKGLLQALPIKPRSDIKMDLGDPQINWQQGKLQIPNNKILSYPTAIGLALREMNNND